MKYYTRFNIQYICNNIHMLSYARVLIFYIKYYTRVLIVYIYMKYCIYVLILQIYEILYTVYMF